MYKASVISIITILNCSKVGNAKTSVYVDSAKIIDNDRLEKVENKIDIAAKKKQIDGNNKIYCVIHSSENKTQIIPDKTKKTLILISS